MVVMEWIEILELSAPLFCQNIGARNMNYSHISRVRAMCEKIHTIITITGDNGVIISWKSNVLLSNVKI